MLRYIISIAIVDPGAREHRYAERWHENAAGIFTNQLTRCPLCTEQASTVVDRLPAISGHRDSQGFVERGWDDARLLEASIGQPLVVFLRVPFCCLMHGAPLAKAGRRIF
jgi:hypothetical protein